MEPVRNDTTTDRRTAVELAKRLLVDSIWRTAKIEVDGVTFPDTQEIFDGRAPEGMSVDDIVTVNNIKRACRKGKGLTDEQEQMMRDHNVPDWYIWSCKQIKYMFPKAHAAAYVMMAWRIAWYKVYHPLAYYAAYFSIRAKAFSYEDMCLGKERLDEKMSIIKNTPKHEVKNADLDLLREMKIADEMYARGYEFWPLDIYKAKAKDFQVIDGKIMPALTSIDGMGEKAAQQVEEAAKGEPFTYLENFRNRTKAPQACIEKMKELGIMGDLSDTDQLSFDFL